MIELSDSEKLLRQREWKSKKTSFCFGGKIMVGNKTDKYIFVCSVSMFLFLSVYFFVFLAPVLWSSYSPALVILPTFIQIFALYNLFACRFSDPGIILRGNMEMPQEIKDEEERQKQQLSYEIAQTQMIHQQQHQQIQQQQMEATMRAQQQNTLEINEDQDLNGNQEQDKNNNINYNYSQEWGSGTIEKKNID